MGVTCEELGQCNKNDEWILQWIRRDLNTLLFSSHVIYCLRNQERNLSGQFSFLVVWKTVARRWVLMQTVLNDFSREILLSPMNLMSESTFRVNSEPESYPSPSQAESQASGFPFFQSSLRSDGRSERGQIRRVVSAIFFQIIYTSSMSSHMITYV